MKKPRYQKVKLTVQVIDMRGVTDEWINKKRLQIEKLLQGRSRERRVYADL